MEPIDIERRRALNRERVRRHRAARALMKEASSSSESNRGTDNPIAESTACSWETQRNDTLGEEFRLDAQSWETQRNKSLYEECKLTASMSESTEQPEAICISNDVTIKKEEAEQEAESGFNFEEFVYKVKASPMYSVASNALCNEEAFQRQATGASSNTAGGITSQSLPIPVDANVLHLLFDAINKLSSEQSLLTAAVNRMNDTLTRLSSEVLQRKSEPFDKKYNLQIPFATREDFVKFDEKLASDEAFRGTLKNSLVQKYDAKKSVTKNITAILRKYMTREVASLYTAQKAIVGKSLFKDTTFSACLLDTIDTLAEDKIIAPVPDNEYLGNLGAVLSNAKDWGVPRHERPTKRQRMNP